eukprot:TRINITY_DN20701_c0_g1_i1.p1 TRINITY_DN20701_c0_g1~~TRINITY_DN20701_c0_g1_i1.p1  ORF type:complete len:151 (-),score=24.31 TRINITY_DN20701_c0_g1_i1:1-453(-)
MDGSCFTYTVPLTAPGTFFERVNDATDGPDLTASTATVIGDNPNASSSGQQQGNSNSSSGKTVDKGDDPPVQRARLTFSSEAQAHDPVTVSLDLLLLHSNPLEATGFRILAVEVGPHPASRLLSSVGELSDILRCRQSAKIGRASCRERV